jgi:hypothetical protein
MITKRAAIFVYLFVALIFVTLQIRLFFTSKDDVETVDTEPLFETTSSIKINPDRHMLVFFNIHETLGTYFDRTLVDNLYYYNAQQKTWKKGCQSVLVKNGLVGTKSRLLRKFECKRWNGKNESWYLSENIVNWHCGRYVGLSDLKHCITNSSFITPPQDLYYISMLRNPITRYLSEYQYIKSNSKWLFEFEPKTRAQNCTKSKFVVTIFF